MLSLLEFSIRSFPRGSLDLVQSSAYRFINSSSSLTLQSRSSNLLDLLKPRLLFLLVFPLQYSESCLLLQLKRGLGGRLIGPKLVRLPKPELLNSSSLKEANLFQGRVSILSRDHIGGRVRLLDSLAILDSVTRRSKSSCPRFLLFELISDVFLGDLRAALEGLI